MTATVDLPYLHAILRRGFISGLPAIESPDILQGLRTARETAGRSAVALRTLGRVLARIYNDPVYIEGVKARYAVRAALDPAWADPLSPLRILNPSPETWEDVAGMSRAHRIEVAVAALRAHAQHRPAPPPAHVIRFGGLVEHRVVRQHTFTARTP